MAAYRYWFSTAEGHGNVEKFLIEGNKPIEDVRSAYWRARSKTGIDIADVCRSTSDVTVSDEHVMNLMEHGYFFPEKHWVKTPRQKYLATAESMMHLLVWYLCLGDSELVMAPFESLPTLRCGLFTLIEEARSPPVPERVGKLEAVVRAADKWLLKSKHAEGCPFHPLGAGCTCGLGDLDYALCDLEDFDGTPRVLTGVAPSVSEE